MRSKTVDGDKLRSARDDAELTQVEVAAALSEEFGRRVHPESISRIERGNSQPGSKMFGALCRLYHVGKADMLPDPDGAEEAA